MPSTNKQSHMKFSSRVETYSNTNPMPVSYFPDVNRDQKFLSGVSEKSLVLHKIMDKAILTNNAKAAEQTLRAGLNPNNCYTHRDGSGKLLCTPYSHAAAFRKSLDVLDLLLKSGTCIDSLNSSEYTMLDAAFVNGHVKTAIWLARHGATPSGCQPSSHIRDNAIYVVASIFRKLFQQGWRPCCNKACKKHKRFIRDIENMLAPLAPYRVSRRTSVKRGMLFKNI
jgi:hypothetical protein